MSSETTVECPMNALLRILMGPWTSYILWTLRQQGPQRFGVLKRLIPGISSRVLTERLRMLGDAGVVHREPLMTIPPQVTYSLTQRGAELSPVLDALDALARKWSEEDVRAGRAFPQPASASPEKTTVLATAA
ncbi:MAG: winged helix-turn-helix transcriptional regulator [Thiomonas sp.]|uniref:Transcriptional regulator, HxlR family protein (Modular protein) n=1 Tax=mine drainage metagenome TaxID=410659 RepID=E6PS69_9ZZZZ